MPAAKPALKAECVRLRRVERLSFREIQERTGASKGSLSNWLRDYPLTDAEKKRRQKAPPPAPKKDRGQESWLHQVVRSRKLGSVQVAKVAEAAVLLRLLAHGFNTFGSMFDGDRAGWVVQIPETGNTILVQVKTARPDSRNQSLPVVELRHGSSHKGGAQRYQEGDFDFIVGYDLYTDTCYVWTWDEVAHLKWAVTICPEAEERWDKFGV